MIKVGYLISYDYNLIFTSMGLLYNYVDEIYLAIDKNRLTWSGNQYELPESFFEEIKIFDTKNKIRFYFDDFYKKDLSPSECETRERIILSKNMGKGWLLQIDVDEYIYDFEEIVIYLKKRWYLLLFPRFTPVVFKANWITLFKQLEDGFLYIKNDEDFPLITNVPFYEYGRFNTNVTNFQTNLQVIHQSWARTEDEVATKLQNWGHTNDFDTSEYLRFWKNLTSDNYDSFKNFHPLSSKIWDRLYFIESKSIDAFLEVYSSSFKQKLNTISLKIVFKDLIKRMLR
jgi:hypothetical protein